MPLANEPVSARADDAVVAPFLSQSPARLRVLIVDAIPSAKMVSLFLGAEYECEHSPSAEAALRLLGRGSQFDLILIDAIQKVVSALEFVSILRERRPEIAVIVMSAVSPMRDVCASMNAGASYYLSKPLSEKQLLEAVEVSAGLRAEPGWRAMAHVLLVHLGLKDLETQGHCGRVVAYSLKLGEVLGFDRRQMFDMELGALLHDVGKLEVPMHILKKPGQLTDAEWVEMRRHPGYGEELLLKAGFPKAVAAVAGQHHERWDGSGYPRGLKGDQIELCARVFSVADTMDAVLSDRCYRRGRSYEIVLGEIVSNTGEQFDPQVAEAFRAVPEHEWSTIRERAEVREGVWETPVSAAEV